MKQIITLLKALLNPSLTLVGLFMFVLFIWYRFIRERLPHEMPFQINSLLGLFCLLYICIIYLYIVISLWSKNNYNNQAIVYILNILYKPLETLDITIKYNPIVKPYYRKLITFCIVQHNKICTYLSTQRYYSLFYVIFQIFPRVIFLTTLAIDIFYFHCLFYIYKVIPILLLILVGRYIVYTCKEAKEHLTLELEEILDCVLSDYIIFDDPNDADDIIPGSIAGITIRSYIEGQTLIAVHDKKREPYVCTLMVKDNYEKSFRKTLGVPLTLKEYRLTSDQRNKRNEPSRHLLHDFILPISIFLEEYAKVKQQSFKYPEVLIFSLYFICWFYILCTSLFAYPDIIISNIDIELSEVENLWMISD
jgi:hypothetical protein